MESDYTIVVPDTAVLANVCGANDSNLKLIEEHLGVPVFTKGNEISICAQGDTSLCDKFRFIIDRIVDEVEQGEQNTSDAVASVLGVGTDRQAGGRLFAQYAISVPGGNRKIYPRTKNQAFYISCLVSHDMVICSGSAGSGKTFLAVAEALRLLLSREKSKIVVTRPVVEAGESLGFLPGDLEQKLNPYLRPIFDALETVVPREMSKKLLESGAIETAPLAYMRGRTLNNAVMILDEAQNTTKEQMKMFLTRMGENTKVFVTGDISQTDLPRGRESGLSHAVRLLSGINDIAMVELTSEDVVRNKLVKKIVEAYDNEN